ncbi:MAG: hypothetical protein ACKPGT_31040 [Microcystis sp.]|jgi:hypothetical protein|uniref:Uncharacterized protein n=1 Tax=Microcystis aeruginosa PCC 9807 TaxID=1160283 RepID=I4H576_MICAE|nr:MULTISPECIES: hypothetical protein [Microcystis]MBE5230698.1 hypothetical protein [Microcystis aeruginosa PMC 728.11]MCZ8226586.1 hypothetical protein [Microcystis sp. LE19-84.1B]CCI17200.1 exported hypothetical protein [Microcystis aeruginosa PCC 9807]
MKSKILAIAALVTLAVFNCFPRISYSQPLLVSKESTTPTSIIIDDDEMAQLPMPVRQGLELYLAGNTGGAVDVWVDNGIKFAKDHEDFFQSAEQARSEVQGWEEFRLKMKKFLKQYAQATGSCKQCVFLQELIYPQNKFLRRFFLKLLHEQDSLFVEFITLQTPKGVYITHIHFEQDLREIIRDDK